MCRGTRARRNSKRSISTDTSANWYTPPTASAACRADPAILAFSPRNLPASTRTERRDVPTSWWAIAATAEHKVCGEGVDRWVPDRPALVKDQFADVCGQRRGAEGYDAAVRMAVNVHLFAEAAATADYGRNVLILPFQAVLRSIAAGTSASPIECLNSDVWLQVDEQWAPSSVVGGCRGRARSGGPYPLVQ